MTTLRGGNKSNKTFHNTRELRRNKGVAREGPMSSALSIEMLPRIAKD